MIELAPLFFLEHNADYSTASATATWGLLGLPGFEAMYAIAGLLAAHFVTRRWK